MLLKFSAYLKDEKVKKDFPDIPEAKGLMKNGIQDFETIKSSFKITETSASIIFKDTYDALRSVLQAFLSKEGYKPHSHEAIIAFNLENGNLTLPEANRFDKFRQLRNDIAYRAVRVTPEEANEIQKLAEQIIGKLKDKI